MQCNTRTQYLARDVLRFEWRELPSVPPNRVHWSPAIPNDSVNWPSIGLGGPICGVHGDWLVVAGGANFPEPGLTVTRSPSLGKVYWDEVFVMHLHTQTWLRQTQRLAQALAYSATVSLPEGVLVIGGEGSALPSGSSSGGVVAQAAVFLLQIHPVSGVVTTQAYPPLPEAIVSPCAVVVERIIIVHGVGCVYRLHLQQLDRGWERVMDHPLGERSTVVGAGIGGSAIFASGRARPGETNAVQTDAYAYDPNRARWETLAPMRTGALAGLGFGVNARFFVVIGGEGDEERCQSYRALEAQRSLYPVGSPQWVDLTNQITFRHDHHTGFNPHIQVYDTETSDWHHGGYLPGAAPVTTQPAQWRGELLLVSGEVGPGKRTPRIWAGRPIVGPEQRGKPSHQ